MCVLILLRIDDKTIKVLLHDTTRKTICVQYKLHASRAKRVCSYKGTDTSVDRPINQLADQLNNRRKSEWMKNSRWKFCNTTQYSSCMLTQCLWASMITPNHCLHSVETVPHVGLLWAKLEKQLTLNVKTLQTQRETEHQHSSYLVLSSEQIKTKPCFF